MSDSEGEENIINPLCITVIGARGLPLPKDGSSAWTVKYAVVKVGDKKMQSVARASHPSHVQWGDTLQFDVASLQGGNITVAVYIQYKVTWEMLGEIIVPLDHYKTVNRRFATEHWYPFGTGGGWKREDKGASLGEVGLIIGVFEGEGKRLKRRHVYSADDPYFDDKGADEIYTEANEVARENLEVLDRIIKTAENTREVGAATLTKLCEQSEEIQQTQKDIDTINEQITFSEEKLRTMESSCKGCCSCFEKERQNQSLREDAVKAEKWEKMRVKAKAKAARERREQSKAQEKNARFGNAKEMPSNTKTIAELSAPIMLSQEGEFNKNQQEIDAGLNHVNNLVQDLKLLAADMSTELDEQNRQLEITNENFMIEQQRMARACDRTKKLI